MELLDIVFRSLSVYFFMIIGIRLFGKGELSQLNSGDVVLLLLISNAVQNAMVGPNTSLEGGLCAAIVLFLANYLLKKYVFKNQKLKAIIEDHPYILVRNGRIFPEILKKVGIHEDELLETVHEHGIEKINQVKIAILEIDGNISVIAMDGKETSQFHRRKLPRKEQNY
jgi:uncharacterized membrane protein YcaP (DUF421 family)